MCRFVRRFARGIRSESGQDAVEYVLLAVLIGLAITAGMIVLATAANASYADAATCIQNVAAGGASGASPGGGGGTGSPGLGGGTGAPGNGNGQGANNGNGGGAGSGGATGGGPASVCP